jgi:protein involved in polysaccharide export with SLBB domain
LLSSTPQPSSRRSPPAQTVTGYILGPDDEIVIRAIDAPEISDKPVLIGTNGSITPPMIGRVKAGGLTVEQLEAELTTRLKPFIQEPQISVTVTEIRSQPVSVFGAVTKPGVVQLRGRQTLYEVLSLAGGPRDTAGSILTVTRRWQSGEIPLPGARVDPTGQFSSAELNAQEILEGKNPAANIEIKPNDIISLSESSSNMIYVGGDVQHAGAFTLGGATQRLCPQSLVSIIVLADNGSQRASSTHFCHMLSRMWLDCSIEARATERLVEFLKTRHAPTVELTVGEALEIAKLLNSTVPINFCRDQADTPKNGVRPEACRFGVPLSFYGDRHSVFVRNDDHWSLSEQLPARPQPQLRPRAARCRKRPGVPLPKISIASVAFILNAT